MADVIAEFERASQRSREIVSRFSLDDTKGSPREGTASMRWTLLMLSNVLYKCSAGAAEREEVQSDLRTYSSGSKSCQVAKAADVQS